MRLFLVFVLCISFIHTSVGQVFAADGDKKNKLIFATFDDSSAEKYAYLRDSIQTMLMSRLSANENVEVIDKVISKKELAVLSQRGADAEAPGMGEADYLVTGGLYSLAHGINVQVAMYPFDPSKKVLNFSKISKKSSDIISDNDALIATILEELLGSPTKDTEESLPASDEVSGFTTAHPEVAYKKGLYSGTVVESELHGIKVKASGLKRSLSVKGEIIASTAGDLDGDGFEELVSLTSSTINLYQIKGKKIVKVGEMKLPNGLRGHAINIADIGKDGKSEIYISATEDLRVASMIIGWNEGEGFQTLAKDIRYYLRPIQIKGGAWHLAGQKRGLAKVDFVKKGIYLLNLDEKYTITEQSQLPVPDGVNLFDFTYAELDGEKGEELVVLDSNEKLRVISKDNELLWVSNSNYGGSKRYIGPSQGSAVDKQSRTNLTVDEDADRELVFVPARILVTDVNKDGLSEIVVNKNKGGALGFLKRLRSYDGGTVVGLAWNGSELTEAWKTGRYKGFVVDYFFQKTEPAVAVEGGVDTLPSSSGRFYVVNMPHSGSFVGLLPGVSETKLTMYELDFFKEKQPDNK